MIRIIRRLLEYLKKKREQISRNTTFLEFIAYWKKYFDKTTIHGLRFLFKSNISKYERFFWLILILLSLVGVFLVSNSISYRYNLSSLSTVVETPYLHISNVRFPAVTLCNANRLNFNKLNETMQRFIPNVSAETRDTFKKLLDGINVLRFGGFSVFKPLRWTNSKELEHLNISEVTQFMSYDCEDLFVKCWWRTKKSNCCDLFAFQKTEYGYCFSFNSYTSEISNFRKKNEENWPLRSYEYGVGSGLIVVWNVNKDSFSKNFNYEDSGVTMMLHHAYEWPSNGYYIPAGTSISVAIKPSYYKTTKSLMAFSPQLRQCLYDFEVLLSDWFYLEGLPYLRQNCMVKCHQKFMNNYCNCSVDLFYPTSTSHAACNVVGLICLSYYNEMFSYEKPSREHRYFTNKESGINCSCLLECTRIEYGVSIKPDLLTFQNPKNDSQVSLNIFYKSKYMMKYRTDATFDPLTIVVAFGGVVAFFFGASLMSGMELSFYILIPILQYIFIKFKSFLIFLKAKEHTQV